jgi:serine/threonine-protein kinase RsbW
VTTLPPTQARTFEGTYESVREARGFVAEALAGSPAAEDARLMASELASNAIMHSASGLPGGTYSVTISHRGAAARVDVLDQGPRPAGAQAEANFGAGIQLVADLAGVFGADAHGSDRWFSVPDARREAEGEASL